MTVKEVAAKVTPEMLDRAIMTVENGELVVRVAYATALSEKFGDSVEACIEGAHAIPLTELQRAVERAAATVSPSREYQIAKVALIGGIQIGVTLALLAQSESVQ